MLHKINIEIINLKEKFLDQSIKFKIIVGIIAILIVAMLVLSILFIKQSEGLLIEALEDKANLLNKNFSIISVNALQENSYTNLQELINEVARKDKELNVLVVADANGTIMASSDTTRFPQFSKIRKKSLLSAIEKKHDKTFRDTGEKLLESIRFIYMKSEDLKEDEGGLIGFLYISLSTVNLENEIMKLWIYSLVLTIVLMGMGIFVAYRFGSAITRPIGQLAEGVRIIASGNLESSIKSGSKDEIGQLISDVEIMRLSIKNLTGNLNEARQYLRNVIDSMPSALIAINSDGTIRNCNQAAVRLMKISYEKESTGKSFWDVLPILNKYQAEYAQILEDRKPKIFNRESIQSDNAAYYDIVFFPLIANGDKGMVIRLDDITELVKKENQLQQAQKMETVGTLAGGLAHDFNNVLSGVIGTLSLLKYRLDEYEDLKKEELEEYISIMDDSSSRASDMVQQLLTLSRKQDITLAPVDLNLTIKHVMKICKSTLEKSINQNFVFTPEPAMVNADPTQIEQVLLNLCVNASHAMTIMKKENETHGGELSVTVEKIKTDRHFCSTHPEADENIEYWDLSVRDTGIGMDTKTIAKIFDPFFTTKEKGRGTGLGLAMVYSIVKQHKGFIDVYSEVGLGSVFRVYIPVLYRNGAAVAQKLQKEEIPRGSGLILVADDEEILRITAKKILEECGYKVILAENGEECVEIYKKRHDEIKAVLIDLIMPKKNGKAAFLEMKEVNRDVKVILASGFRHDERVDDVMRLGIKEFVQKPYTLMKLASAVSRAIA